MPKICKQAIEQIDKRLANPLDSYVEQIIADSEAETYQWVGPGKRIHCKNSVKCNRKHFQAVSKALRIYSVTGDQKNIECDLRKAVAKHVLWLKEMRRKMERGIETGEIRFY